MKYFPYIQDGELREFSQPVKVSQVLQNVDSASFVYDLDDINVGEFISTISKDEELQLGQLYFVLPSTCLNRPVQAEEMAALAVKASAALRRLRSGEGSGGLASCCGSKALETLEFAIKKDVNTYQRMRRPALLAAEAVVGGNL